MDTWLAQCWQAQQDRAPDALPVLTPAAEAWLWRQVVADTPAEAGLGTLDVRALADTAAEAYGRALAHGLEPRELTAETLEQEHFLEWVAAFEARCAKAERLPAARLAAALHASAPLPESAGQPLALWLPDTWAPALRAAVMHLAGGNTVALAPLSAAAAGLAQQHVHRAEDAATVEAAAIAWAAARLAADPGARIAWIHPEAATHRGRLQRLLDRALHGDRAAGEEPVSDAERRWTFGAALPLSEQPLAHLAVLSLALCLDGGAPLPWQDLSAWLLSALAGSPEESPARVRCELALRREPDFARQPAAWRARLARTPGLERTAQQLEAAVQALRAPLAGRSTALPSRWAESFDAALLAVGWPGRGRDSDAHQVAARIRESLHQLAQLDGVTGAMPATAALREWRGLLAATAFQPEAPQARLWVLDTLADAGLALDGLWVSQLTAERFPAAPAPHPFLPFAAQRAQRLPHADAALEMDYALDTLRRWRDHATELVLAWAPLDGEVERVPSPLLPDVETAWQPPAATATWGDLQLAAGPLLAPLPADDFAAWSGTGALPGGARLLELQSQCPFRAGTELRLRAQRLESPPRGFDPRLSGELFHRAAAGFWAEVRDHATLVALTPREVAERSRTAARQAVAEVLAQPAWRAYADLRLAAVEADWVGDSLAQLVAHEALREPFTVVAHEVPQSLEIAGRRIDVRIDRIDQLVGGGTVIIDYKTSSPATSGWFGERPAAPQLPAYAAHAFKADDVAAVAFAAPAGKVAGFSGLGVSANLLPGVPSTTVPAVPFTPADGVGIGKRSAPKAARGLEWPAVFEGWQAQAAGLVSAFAAGEAAVDPRPQACRYCHLAGLCRIDAPATEEAPDAVDDEGSEA